MRARITKSSKYIVDHNWVAASSTYNYMLKDPLLDWLNFHHKTFSNKNHEYKLTIQDCNKLLASNLHFTTQIMQQGHEFERHIINYLSHKFTSKRVAEINGELAPKDIKKVNETLEAMKAGVPFIHSGVLHNPTNKTFGIPDLLVRSDWLKHLVTKNPIAEELETISAPKITKQKWHYRVVDIKFTSLLLRADGIHLLNAASFPAYKVQLAIYNQALGRLQGYTPDQVYILGRRCKYTSKGDVFVNNNCFHQLAVIDYKGLDIDFLQSMDDAIQWMREVSQPEAATWDITNYPLHRWELYPNMCNQHDGHWHAFKTLLAQNTKELTSLWMVGPKNRNLALNANISQWSHKRCNANTLGITGHRQHKIVDSILKVNKSKRLRILPSRIKNDLGLWKTSSPIEFFVDFETTNDAIAEITDVTDAKANTLVFMIGVGFIDPLTKTWNYHNFTVNHLTFSEENRIFQSFLEFLFNTSKHYRAKHFRCIHWSQAEYNLWQQVTDRHPQLLSKGSGLNWLDLLLVFKEEPIVINGCMSFGLKDVASSMKKHGFIQTSWNKDSLCVDGLSAMIAAYNAHKQSLVEGKTMKDIPIMQDIITYNEVDVKVLSEIITYLRENHIETSGGKKRKSVISTTENKKSRLH